MTSHVTVARGRLTYAGLLMVNTRSVGEEGVHFLRYGATSNLDLGIGYWSDEGRARPAVNWQAISQSKRRPALLIGYGSEPVGEWKDDGVYLSLVKGFGPGHCRTHAFAALFRELSGGTNHLIGGVSRPLGRRWSLFAGKYLFNTWDGSVNYQLTPEIQLGLWACDFTRSTKIGLSLGAGFPLKR